MVISRKVGLMNARANASLIAWLAAGGLFALPIIDEARTADIVVNPASIDPEAPAIML